LTVGTIHGGNKNNIIPDEVTLGLTLRTYSPQLRDQIVADIRRTANGLAEAYGLPADRMPIVKLGEGTSATINDSALAERLRAVGVAALGTDRVLDNKIPAVMFRLGAVDPEKLAESKKNGVPLPGLHSALFAPVYTPAISTGVTAMTAMALDLLK
jgi:hippurate hydrolase